MTKYKSVLHKFYGRSTHSRCTRRYPYIIHIRTTYLLYSSMIHNCYIVRRIDLSKLSYSSTNAKSFDLIHLSMAHQMSAQGRVAFVVVMYSRGYVSKFTV